jgi:hypothetical protein
MWFFDQYYTDIIDKLCELPGDSEHAASRDHDIDFDNFSYCSNDISKNLVLKENNFSSNSVVSSCSAEFNVNISQGVNNSFSIKKHSDFAGKIVSNLNDVNISEHLSQMPSDDHKQFSLIESLCTGCNVNVNHCICHNNFLGETNLYESNVDNYSLFVNDDMHSCVVHHDLNLPSPGSPQWCRPDVSVHMVDGFKDLLDPCLDNLFYNQGYESLQLDFNVNDILSNLKFKPVNNFVKNCSVCNYLASVNVHSFHNSFGFFNFSPLIISSNVPGFSIQPVFSSYLSVQHLYTGTYNFISKIVPIASHINVNLFREIRSRIS